MNAKSLVRRPRPVLAVLGGMLGAGKTSLALAAARRLSERGLRAALITNDQGSGLVDTALARAARVPVREVTGGCFCCRLSDLLRASKGLDAFAPDVVFAEPVGSCTDLVATVLRPLLRDEPWRFRIAPLTVLVDPVRARALAAPDADPDLAYLFRHQLEEADIICASKADEQVAVPPLDVVMSHRVSAHTGQGLDRWLDQVLGDTLPAGALPLVSVDYERYAAAEAALAWLNWHASVDLNDAASPAVVAGLLGDRLEAALTRASLQLVHVKVLDQTGSGSVRVSLCGDDRVPGVDGALDAPPDRRHHLLINARVVGDPQVLARVIGACIRALEGDVRLVIREAFRPSPPRPERRVDRRV